MVNMLCRTKGDADPKGKPNFVMGEEYPAAKLCGITILPAEMEKTDRALLGEKFENIPECVDAHDGPVFRERLLDAIRQAARPWGRPIRAPNG